MAIDQDKIHHLLMSLVGDVGAAMSAALVLIGDQLGLYRILAAQGPFSSSQLASAANLNERMVREWLLNQAASGYINYDERAERYFMTPEQAAAFADEKNPFFFVGAFDIIASVHRDAPKIAQTFRTGRGLPWGEHDGCLFCGSERFFGSTYRANLVDSWIPALEGIRDRLDRGGSVADIGCGHGASTLLMAKAFPKSRFFGYDSHEPSIQCARKRAKDAGVSNVTFEVADAVNFPVAPTVNSSASGGYDFTCCFDCLHDMGDPIGCARRVRATLKPDGAWMVVEPNAADTVKENLNPITRVFSAASTMICVPASMAYNGPALGACAGEKRLREVMVKGGGFTKFRRATQTPFNMVLEARP